MTKYQTHLSGYCLADGAALHFLFYVQGNLNLFIHSPCNKIRTLHAVNQGFN